ncbi:hypothetical protein FA10DRAFT_102396 [Acaromyces ingoldii]|uniref:Uncharacterized protein n=1 Tax=Acaromyces ingoldii TaxID=215250 RepID=A0A316YLR9_9BASI|nr:hypothetical protein FA10DRAFT_102396 [Acaromyces ingoldii]PWN90016.1 hypothetical protein FA10DRAFT_102396 [Acaromyces ingoldii]
MASTSQLRINGDRPSRNNSSMPSKAKRRRAGANSWAVASALVGLLAASLLGLTNASPVTDAYGRATNSLERRDRTNYTDPNDHGGQMLTIIPNVPGLGEPINVIVSGLSDASVLSIEGFLLWATSINFGVSCLGQANGTNQLANLGDGKGNVTQGTGDGDNGVLRWNYGDAYVGTCKETFQGGNHFRWWRQAGTNAFFLASSVELDLSTSHMIAQNGYNAGRDELVGNATASNGTRWEAYSYNTTVEWVPAGVLLNATTDGINHPQIALEGQPAQDGRIAVLTVKQLTSGRDSAMSFMRAPPILLSILAALLIGLITFA